MFLFETLFNFFLVVIASKAADIKHIANQSFDMLKGSVVGDHKIAKSLLSKDVHSCICSECGKGIDIFINNMNGMLEATGKISPHVEVVDNIFAISGNYFSYVTTNEWKKNYNKKITMRSHVYGGVDENGHIYELHMVCGKEEYENLMSEMANIPSNPYIYNMLKEAWNANDIERIVSYCSEDAHFIIAGQGHATSSVDIIPTYADVFELMQAKNVQFFNYRETCKGFEFNWIGTWRLTITDCVFHAGGYDQVDVDKGKITHYFHMMEGDSVSMTACNEDLMQKYELQLN